MKAEEMVVSYELAVRLEQAGMEQEGSYFCWVPRNVRVVDSEVITEGWRPLPRHSFDGLAYTSTFGYAIAAPTAAELGEHLPEMFALGASIMSECWLRVTKSRVHWHVQYLNQGDARFSTISETEADARALMLLELVQRGLLTFNQPEQQDRGEQYAFDNA